MSAIARWLEERREGRRQAPEDVAAFVAGVLSGEVTRAQAAAWLAFVTCRGMSDDETAALTLAMAGSGARLRWPGIPGPFVDKHSTGGVGDKVSLVLAPVWAALGLRVPMISGRGLGLTGGTLDKLESIPGYRTDLDAARLHGVLAEAGCFINGQTREIAPADRILYALRDETGTVPAIPLITASILSKKLVEGLDRLVLDVKHGSGAFMADEGQGRALADSLVRVGRAAGLEIEAFLTDMNEPLGEAVGNALEVEEALRCLGGGGPADLADLVARLSGQPDAARKVLADGSALEAFRLMVRGHGGDPDAPLQGAGCQETVITAGRPGRLARCDARAVARAAFLLGAGRTREGAAIHPGVGVRVHAKGGTEVERGQPLATLVHTGQQLAAAREALAAAFVFT